MRNRILAIALSLAGLASIAAPAVALAAPAAEHARVREEAKFPMPAADFQTKVNARLTKARAKMEERAAKLDADKAKEVRAHFDAKVARVNDEVAKAVADGTVTKDEAHQVRQAMHPNGGKHARAQKK